MYKRNKYDYEFRLRCVEAVTKGKRAIKEVAKENGIEALSSALLTINSAWGREGKCYSRQFIRGLGKLYAIYPELSIDRMVKQLRPEVPGNIERQAHIINGGTSTRGGNTLIPYGLAFLHFYNKGLRSGKIDPTRLSGAPDNTAARS